MASIHTLARARPVGAALHRADARPDHAGLLRVGHVLAWLELGPRQELLRLDGLDTGGAVEAGAGDHVGGAVQEPAEGAGHIAEAVIERDGDTDSVRLKQRVINKGQFRDGASYFLIIAYPVADLMRIVD